MFRSSLSLVYDLQPLPERLLVLETEFWVNLADLTRNRTGSRYFGSKTTGLNDRNVLSGANGLSSGTLTNVKVYLT